MDVGGVGYEVALPIRSMAQLPHRGETVTLFTHLHVREDGMALYGFWSEGERDLFRVLLGASGVGPKVALAILGVFTVEGLTRAVVAEDVDALVQVPGVGKRGAQKLILDLKPKIADLEPEVMTGGSSLAQLRQALENLGYATSEIRMVLPVIDTAQPLGEQVRQALKELGR